MGFLDRLGRRLGDLVEEVVGPEELRARLQAAERALDGGRAAEAAELLAEALRLEPEHPRTLYLLGLAQGRLGRRREAIECLEKATALRDDLIEAQVALGDLRRDAGEQGLAEHAYKRALAAGPRAPELLAAVHRALGELYLAGGRADKAVRELRKASALAPADGGLAALLGRAFIARGDHDLARAALVRAATSDGASAATLSALGALYLDEQEPAEAARAFARATELAPQDEIPQVGLAEAHRRAGDLERALAVADEALARAPGRPALHAERARTLAARGAPAEALAAFAQAVERWGEGAAPADLLAEATQAALRAGEPERAAKLAEPFLAQRPDDPVGLSAHAAAALAAGAPALADALVARARQAAPRAVEPLLLAARRALEQGPPEGAIAAARAALDVAGPLDAGRAQGLLEEAYARRAGVGGGASGLRAALTRLHRQLLRERELGGLAPEAARLLAALDRPLLVAVLGEFNSGKSTFVNALLGEDVAPMGITPTTATVNVFRHGATPAARVLYRDDRIRELPWGEVPAMLRALDDEEARRIRQVELLHPSPALARLTVVDTPGLNAILPEHEEVARGFVGEADAVIWLFACGQAGKETERAALDEIRRLRRAVLGVVNKADQVAPEELEAILAHLGAGFAGLLEALVPLSARQALAARHAGDEALLARSRQPELLRALDERFLSRARAVQREACAARVSALGEEVTALRGAADERQRAADGALAGALAVARAQGDAGGRALVASERRALTEHVDATVADAAREVLDFVRPRRWIFGGHGAEAADRDFLVGLLEEKLDEVAARSRARVAAALDAFDRALGAALAAAPAAGAPPPFEPRRLDEEVYGRCRAFARGWLRGGRVERFFDDVLPRIDLEEEPVRRALARHAIDVEAELLAPLRAFLRRRAGELVAALEARRRGLAIEQIDLEARAFSPVERLAREVAREAGAGRGDPAAEARSPVEPTG